MTDTEKKDETVVEEKETATTDEKTTETKPATEPKPEPKKQTQPQQPQPKPQAAPQQKPSSGADPILEEEIKLYIQTAQKGNVKNTINRFWNIVNYILRKPTDVNMEAVLKLFKDHKDTILTEKKANAGADQLDATKSMKIAIVYHLFRSLTKGAPKKDTMSAYRVKSLLNEDIFLWFNKKFPKGTFRADDK